MGLRQGCPLSATSFGLFIDGLHHFLETVAPGAGVQIQLVRSKNWFMLITVALRLPRLSKYRLIDALAAYGSQCLLHMEFTITAQDEGHGGFGCIHGAHTLHMQW
ncbi:hypothetical protein ABBQ32_001533 [Trebouxia sp. C0010 RCD-2024]